MTAAGGSRRKGVVLVTILAVAALGVTTAARPARPDHAVPSHAQPPPPPPVGIWKLGSFAEVEITADGGDQYTGTTRASGNPCFHDGDVSWHMSGTAPHFTGTTLWRYSFDCSDEGLGPSTWDLSGSPGDYTLRECSSEPGNPSNSYCADWLQQLPFVVISPSSLDGVQGARGDLGEGGPGLDFANQQVGVESPVQQLRITNGGAADLTISDVPASSGPFTVKNPEDCTTNPISPDGSCVLDVTFTPTAPGHVPSELAIADDALDSPQLVVFEGTGTDQGIFPARAAESEGTAIQPQCGKILGWELLQGQQPRTLIGEVVQSHVASEDASVNALNQALHRNSDFNFFVYPDFAYRDLLSSPGNWHTGDAYEQGRIEVEWERWSAHWPGGIPQWAWPAQGDRVMTVGNHIFDCGHKKEGHRSEIHPPRFLATYRNAALSRMGNAPPLNEISGRLGSFDPGSSTAATRVDVWASSYGGPAIRSEDAETPGRPNWFQPVNAQDYTFTIMAPPKPYPGATLAHSVQTHNLRGADAAQGPDGGLIFDQRPLGCDPAVDCLGYRVTLPGSVFSGDDLMAYGATALVYWTGDKVPTITIRHVVVTLTRLHVREALTEDWSLYGYVNELGRGSVLRGRVQATNEDFHIVEDGQTVCFGPRPGAPGCDVNANRETWAVDLVPGQPLRLAFRASAWGLLGASDFMGTAERIWDGPASTALRIHSSANLAIGHEGDTDQACGNPCFWVSVSIAVTQRNAGQAPDSTGRTAARPPCFAAGGSGTSALRACPGAERSGFRLLEKSPRVA